MMKPTSNAIAQSSAHDTSLNSTNHTTNSILDVTNRDANIPRWADGTPIRFMSADIHCFIEIRRIDGCGAHSQWKPLPLHKFRAVSLPNTEDSITCTELCFSRNDFLFALLKNERVMSSSLLEHSRNPDEGILDMLTNSDENEQSPSSSSSSSSVSSSASSSSSSSSFYNSGQTAHIDTFNPPNTASRQNTGKLPRQLRTDLIALPLDISILVWRYLREHRHDYHSHTLLSLASYTDLCIPYTKTDAKMLLQHPIEIYDFRQLFSSSSSTDLASANSRYSEPLYLTLLHYLRWLTYNGEGLQSENEYELEKRLLEGELKRAQQRNHYLNMADGAFGHNLRQLQRDNILKRIFNNLESFRSAEVSDCWRVDGNVASSAKRYLNSPSSTSSTKPSLPKSSRFLNNPYIGSQSILRQVYKILYDYLPFPVPLLDILMDYCAPAFEVRLIYCFDSYVW